MLLNLLKIPISHLKFIHKVRHQKWQTKSDFEFYQFFFSGVMSLDCKNIKIMSKVSVQ